MLKVHFIIVHSIIDSNEIVKHVSDHVVEPGGKELEDLEEAFQ